MKQILDFLGAELASPAFYFGALGLILSIIAFQFKKHNQIVMSKMTSELIFSLQYLLLGAWTAALLDFTSAVRNMLFCAMVKRGRSTKWLIYVFGAFVVVVGVVTFSGPVSVMLIAAKLLTTISYGMKNERLLRFITLPSCVFWCVYNLYVGSLGGAIGDCLTLCSMLVAVCKFDLHLRKPVTNAHAKKKCTM